MIRRASLALAVVLLMVGSAAGQEQRLQYRCAQQPNAHLPTVGQRQLEIVAEAPKGVDLPSLSTKAPLFAQWETPAAPAGRVWMAFDQSAQESPYDRLFIDADADGSLADEPAVEAYRTRVLDSSTGPRRRRYADYGPVKVLFPGKDGPVAYHLAFSLYTTPEYRRLYVISAGWYEGAVTLGDRKVLCTLIDAGVNGRFNDTGTNRKACDAIRLAGEGDPPKPAPQFDPTTHFVGGYVEHGGNLYRLTVAPDGASVAFAPAGDVRMGKVRVADDVARLSVFGPEGSFLREPSGGVVTVPAGRYEVYQWERQRKDDDGKTWSLVETGAVKEEPFVVMANQTVDLGIGRDVTARLKVRSSGRSQHTIAMTIQTAKGDYIRLHPPFASGLVQVPAPKPKVRIASADGTYDRTYDLEYG